MILGLLVLFTPIIASFSFFYLLQIKKEEEERNHEIFQKKRLEILKEEQKKLSCVYFCLISYPYLKCAINPSLDCNLCNEWELNQKILNKNNNEEEK